MQYYISCFCAVNLDIIPRLFTAPSIEVVHYSFRFWFSLTANKGFGKFLLYIVWHIPSHSHLIIYFNFWDLSPFANIYSAYIAQLSFFVFYKHKILRLFVISLSTPFSLARFISWEYVVVRWFIFLPPLFSHLIFLV